jgi:tRNA-uridine 2-sulfurtransferase
MSEPQFTALLGAIDAPAPDPNRLIVVAMSGGVDSSVVAGLLVEAGHRVVGMTMRLYDARGSANATGGRCCGPRDIEDARAFAEHLGIPYYVVDLEAEFSEQVVEEFVESYLSGETPNPCVKCNQYIKFTPLLQRARAMGADVLATGHYARIESGGHQSPTLRRGVDPNKDQSYFLFSMPGDELNSVWFPLGAMSKDDVRRHADRLQLPNKCKQESQEICFIPDGNYAGFVAASALRRGRPLPLAGAIVDSQSGDQLGKHDGVHRYTVGQHRGLGNLTTKDKLYVTAIDPARGRVEVGPYDQAARRELNVRDFRWLSPPRTGRFEAALQVRHRGVPMPATVEVIDGKARVSVEGVPQVAAPGQAAVLYIGDRVVGGGWVAKEIS